MSDPLSHIQPTEHRHEYAPQVSTQHANITSDLYDVAPKSRREEVERIINDMDIDGYDCFDIGAGKRLARTLADEVDELRGKLDDVRMGIGCARGQRSTQFCAEVAARDEIIGKLLEMLVVPEDDPEQWAAACCECGWIGMSMSCEANYYEAGDCDVLCPECGAPVDELGCKRQVLVAHLHAAALEIAGRKE